MKNQFLAAALKIRNEIKVKNLTAGTLLPSSKTLSTQLGLNPATTLRACQVLISEGLLYRKGYKLMVASGGRSASAVEGVLYVVSYLDIVTRLVDRILTERGVSHRLIELSQTRHPSLEPILKKVLAEKPAGMIIWKPLIDPNTVSLLETIQIPMVICPASTLHLDRSSVQIDLYRGVEVALRHLHDLGHRHIAHMAFGDEAPGRELAYCYRVVCLALDLPQSASTIWRGDSDAEEVVRHTLLAGRQGHPEVTALFGDALAGFHATRIFDVPRELSVVGFYGIPYGLESRPPLTTIELRDSPSLAQWACNDLISQIQTLESGRPPKASCKAFLVPDLLLGKSTRALGSSPIASQISSHPPPAQSDPWETWRKTYPFLQNKGSDNWRQLDLSKLANHGMTRQHGWLGAEPLEHFPSGLRSIHGVLFQILDEERNDGRAVVTFRSPHTHSAGTKQLPVRARIKVNSRATALYFLHGCGHASPVAFAKYVIHFKSGESFSVPLIPLGPSRRLALERLGQVRPNLQDWWGTIFEQEHFPHAHHATVFNPADPEAYQRSIYSLEWINPRAEEEISFIEARVDPKAGPVLALIAVTALL